MPRTKLFVSYSHKDIQWLQRLQIHLKPLEQRELIELWDDTRIKSGSNWRREIEQALAAAKVAVLLLSADFLASKFITTDELPNLLAAANAERILILPIIVSPCLFTHIKELQQFQAVNSPDRPLRGMKKVDQEEVFLQVAKRIFGVLPIQPVEQQPDYEGMQLALRYSDHCVVDLRSVTQIAACEDDREVTLQWHPKVLKSLSQVKEWHHNFEDKVQVFRWSTEARSSERDEKLAYLRAQIAKYYENIQRILIELQTSLHKVIQFLHTTNIQQRELTIRSFAGFSALRLIQSLQNFENRLYCSQHGPITGSEGLLEAIPLGRSYLKRNEFYSFDLPFVPPHLLEIVPDFSTLGKLVFFFNDMIYSSPDFLVCKVGPGPLFRSYEYIVLPKILAEWLHEESGKAPFMKNIEGSEQVFYEWVLPQWLVRNYNNVPSADNWYVWVLQDKFARQKFSRFDEAPWEK